MSRTYEQLEPVISALDDRIKTNLKAFPTDTASGAVASFADGADDIPLKSLVVDINPVRDLSQGDPSPENICPISGWTGCAVSATGKNLFNKNINLTPYKLINASGDIVDYTSYCYSDYIKVNPNTAYVFSGVIVGQTYQSVAFYDNEKTFISRYMPSTVGIQAQFTTPSTCQYIRVNFDITNYTNPSNLDTVQLEEGTVASEHEAFGTTIPISWASEAGTVYGGKLDVLSGALTVDRKYIKFDGSEDEIWYTYSSTGFRIPMGDIGPSENGICNLAQTVSSASSYGVMFNASANYIYFFQAVSEWGVTTIEDLRTWLATNNVEVCYEINTPITIQLTPHGVNSLLGANNIFADTGDTSCEYRADTKMYIERPTEPDADMIADSNIVSGQYFMVGNTLYKATANIASGSAVIEGTNCTQKSLSEALNEINQ